MQRGITRSDPTREASTSATSIPSSAPAVPSEPADIIVSIPADTLDRMHLNYGVVTEESASIEVRVPGTVQPNAYREVHVTPIAGGVTTQVTAELGQSVKRGQPMAR